MLPFARAALAYQLAEQAELSAWDPAALHAALEAFAKSKGFVNDKGVVNVGPVAQPVRVAVAGVAVTPPLDVTLAVVGREGALQRIDTCLAQIG